MSTSSNQLGIDSVRVRRVGGDDLAATIAVTIMPHGGKGLGFPVTAEIVECGVDGVRASTPLAATAARIDGASGEVWLSIPTPFRWSDADSPMYAVTVRAAAVDANCRAGSPDPAGLFQHSAGIEITFGFTADDTVQVVGETRVGAQPLPLATTPGPRLFVIGDSTAFSFGSNQLGWADALARMLPSGAVRVCNRARPGRSTRTFRREGLWARTGTELRPGDIILIQFGHNDADALDRGRCRGVLPGIGAEQTTVRLPNGREEVVHSFGCYLRQYVEETRARGARPVLLSPTPMNVCCDGRLERKQGPYGGWAAEVAQLCEVDFLDVGSRVADCYDALGPTAVAPLFCHAGDPVHPSPPGAEVVARCVAAALAERQLLSP